MRDANEQFKAALSARGIIPPGEIIADGRIHRCDAEGRNGRNDAAYLLHLDGIAAGGFENWRDGRGWENWRAEVGHMLSPAEESAYRAQVEAMRRVRDVEHASRKAEARERAAAIWKAAQPASDNHPYLARKGIKPHSLREHKGALVVPVLQADGLHSLQFIGADGDKRFLPGGRVTGCYFIIGDPKDAAALCIAEGYATGATIHEATGHPVAVAFNAGNLGAVAKAMRERFPELSLILCADDDVAAEGNPGITKATEAARSVGGLLATPDFGTNRPPGVSDFNDMAALHGLEAVKQAIASASAPARREHLSDPEHAPAVDSAGRIAYRRASDIQAKPIRWLWQGRIARGKVSMLAGNPGLGKSQITASMAAIVSTGGTWPVERTRCAMGNAVILSAEDDPEDTIRPRLEAAGADLSRVFILDAVVEGYPAAGGEIRRAFNLKTDLARLGAMLEEIGGAALIVIDPITAYLGDADSHKNAEIRALLAPLSDLAAKHGAAVVCVSHFNKATGSETLMRITGSLAFVAAARAAFIVAKDPENEARRLFLPLKNNIANDQTGLAFAVQSAQVKSSAGLIETSRVTWEAEAVTVTADEAMTQQADPDERGEMDDAKDFLRGLLAGGAVPSKQIRADAEGAGHAWRTIQRAQKALGIEAVKRGMAEGWVWRLTGHPTHEDRQETSKNATQNVWQPSHSSGAVGGLQGDQAGAIEVEI